MATLLSQLQATAVRPWEELTLRAISDPRYYDDGREMPSSQKRQMSIPHIPVSREYAKHCRQ